MIEKSGTPEWIRTTDLLLRRQIRQRMCLYFVAAEITFAEAAQRAVIVWDFVWVRGGFRTRGGLAIHDRQIRILIGEAPWSGPAA